MSKSIPYLRLRKFMRNQGLLTSAGTINQKFLMRYVNIIQEGYNFNSQRSYKYKGLVSTCPPSFNSESHPVFPKFTV
jgi:hypothetical protein